MGRKSKAVLAAEAEAERERLEAEAAVEKERMKHTAETMYRQCMDKGSYNMAQLGFISQYLPELVESLKTKMRS